MFYKFGLGLLGSSVILTLINYHDSGIEIQGKKLTKIPKLIVLILASPIICFCSCFSSILIYISTTFYPNQNIDICWGPFFIKLDKTVLIKKK
jgi:hypothetical protein